MRKLFSLFLSLVVTTSLWAYDFQVGDLCYNITSNTAPCTVEVTYQGEDVGSNYAGLTSVSIPETVTYEGVTYDVTSIGVTAFGGSSLTFVTIPESITTIGDYAFGLCNDLPSITIPKSVTNIGLVITLESHSISSIVIDSENPIYDSRENCNAIIETATNTLVTGCHNTIIPNTVTRIGDYAFYGCSNLPSITIPESVTSIGDFAFYNCSSLTSIHLQSTTPPVLEGDNIFTTTLQTCYIPCATKAAYEASAWAQYVSEFVEEDCVDPTWQILYTSTDGNIVTPYASDVFGTNIVSNEYKDGQGVITFDGPVTSIGEDAFSYCSSLTSVTIPNSVTSIGGWAFAYCSSLASVTIGNSVTIIGYDAFYSCSSLTTTNYTGDIASWCNIKFGSFDANPMCYSQHFYINDQEIKDLVIPNTVDSIHDYAFFYCSSLASVTIGNSVTSIGENAFSGCSLLNGIDIPNSVTRIGSNAFSNCTSLTFIKIPESVVVIENTDGYPSHNNIALSTPNLKSIIVDPDNPVYDSREGCNAVIETATNKLIFGCQNTFIPNSVASIGYVAFYDCTTLTSIDIPSTVKSIREGAFHNTGIDSVYIPAETIVEDWKSGMVEWCGAFSSCQNLTNITFAEGIKRIPSGVIAYCPNIRSVHIPSSVTSIGLYAFSGCSSLTSITCDATIPPTLEDDKIFTTTSLTCYVPCGTKAAYEASDWAQYVSEFVEDGCVDPTWQILYTSTDGNIVTPYRSNLFGANIVSNEYKDGQGVITFDGPVTSIGYAAFYKCSSLISVTIPNSVTSIGRSAFAYCDSLTSITIPNSVMSIGIEAFRNCYALTSVTIGNSVTSLGEWAFFCCTSLTSITIGNSVTSIGEYAFCGCRALASITIPNSVTSIGDMAFQGCDSLVSVTIPESVNSIGDYPFRSCPSLTSMVVDGSNTTYDSRDNCNAIIESASNTLIAGCQNTIIPNSVTSIGDAAFYYCSSLISITIPESVNSIGEGVFVGCSSLTSIVVDGSNTTYDSRDNCDAIIETATNTLITGCQNTIIPNGVTNIGKHAFRGCASLTSITIPNSVTSIGDNAFRSCSSFNTIYLEATTPPTLLGANVFAGTPAFICHIPCGTKAAYEASDWAQYVSEFVEEDCNPTWQILYTSTDGNIVTPYKSNVFGANIVSNEYKDGQGVITFDGPVTGIGEWAFAYCDSLTSVTIPESVTSIGDMAFCNCFTLNKTNYMGDIAGWCEIEFRDTTANPISYSHNFYINDQEIKDLVIPNTVDTIHNYAFYNCASLTSVTIGSGVTSIGWDAFSNCDSLTSVTIPESVTSMGYSFHRCSSLTSVVWNANISSLGDSGPFWDCPITSFSFGENVKYIPDFICTNLNLLGSITIPNSVTSIGIYAFNYCSSLTSVTIPEGVTSIGGGAFSGCSSLASITIPNSVTSIGDAAFYYCTSLNSITIPNSVKSIGYGAFGGCSSLASITCEAMTPPTVEEHAFAEVSTSIPVYVPCGSENAYKAAYGWNDFTNIQGPLAEYSIQVSTSNSQIGTALVDYNTSCGNQITATANYGYHFVQWSDGNTDNPRTLFLTQDTTLIAEFAPNNYTLSVQSANTERGTTSGDVTTTYLDYVTISAIANYGYHFSHWNDYNYDNPRQVQVTENKTYTAYFDKNTYYITKNYDSNQGYVNGSTSGEYLDNITLTAEPKYGYHFLQWSDGNTDNPRTITLTQDTVLTAEFALTIAGQCGKNLYWVYDTYTTTLTITGSGDMYNERPWGLLAKDIAKVLLPYGITHIGNDAFRECLNLREITIPATVTSIGDQSFAGCRNLRNINCYPLLPPYAETTSFANYNVNLNVPCDYLEDYQYDIVFGSFKYINCMSSDEVEDAEDVEIDAGTTDVTIIWPTKENAYTYTIVIKKNGQVVCTLVFDAFGRLLNISFAPGRDGNHPAQYAEALASGGFRFTVTGLEEGTDYTYDITTTDESDNTLSSHSGEFTTQSNTPTDLENTDIQAPEARVHKLLRNGQLIILRDGVEYNAMGAQIQ